MSEMGTLERTLERFYAIKREAGIPGPISEDDLAFISEALGLTREEHNLLKGYSAALAKKREISEASARLLFEGIRIGITYEQEKRRGRA